MPTRSSKHMDMNQLAKSILDQATGVAPKVPHGEQLTGKSAAARKGGLAGGAARMAKLSQEQKSELGKQAREARRMKEALASKEASANAKNQLNKVN